MAKQFGIHNAELKARMPAAGISLDLEKGYDAVIKQTDTYYPCIDGRKLKLRDNPAELILYRRIMDKDVPVMQSVGMKMPIKQPLELESILTAALGSLCTVRKTRKVWLRGRTRIHVDEVETLPGKFVEVEVVLGPGETYEEGVCEARCAMAGLGIAESDIINGSYSDMIMANKKK